MRYLFRPAFKSTLTALALACTALAVPQAHANMPPPPSIKAELNWILDGLLGDQSFAAWSPSKELFATQVSWAQEGTGLGLSVHVAPATNKGGKDIEVYDPNTDIGSDEAKSAVMSKARIALRAELGGGDFKPLNFVAWPTAPKGDEQEPLPTMQVPTASLTLEVKKQVVFATVPGLKKAVKAVDLTKDGMGKTHVAHVVGVFTGENCPYVLVAVNYDPKDYTEANVLNQVFAVKIPTAPPAK